MSADKFWTEERINLAVAMREEGRTLKQIAEAVGASSVYVVRRALPKSAKRPQDRDDEVQTTRGPFVLQVDCYLMHIATMNVPRDPWRAWHASGFAERAAGKALRSEVRDTYRFIAALWAGCDGKTLADTDISASVRSAEARMRGDGGTLKWSRSGEIVPTVHHLASI